MNRVTSHDRAFLPLFAGMILLAWGALVIWDVSPYARYLDHDWTQLGLIATLCMALPAGTVLLPLLLYVSGWVLMTAAMMVPTTLPLITVFRRLTMRRPNHSQLLALLLVGYLIAWLGFGLAAHVLSLALGEVVRRSPWLTFNGWPIAAAVLFLAGLFQFSSLKYRCLEACRSPIGFVTARWQGRRPRMESFRLGLSHGVYCIGCCWALMLLMFVVGTGSIGWMLVLGAFMALEKNSRWGRRMAGPLGVVLIFAACAVIAAELT